MSKEKEILRELAFQVTEVAASPRMIKLKEEWKRHNSLNSPRPMICVSPEGSWREIIRSEDLLCEDELLRSFERTLRMKLYWANEIGDDTPVSEYFNIPYQVKETPYLKGMEDVEQRVSDTGSFHYKKLIDDLEEGLERLRFRQVSLDRQESERRLSVAEECFGDLLKVRHRGAFWWTLGITAEVIKLIGLEDLMIDMYEDPEGLHKLMAWFRDEHLNLMDQYEKLGILSLNNEDDLIASGGIGYPGKKDRPVLPFENFSDRTSGGTQQQISFSGAVSGRAFEMSGGYGIPFFGKAEGVCRFGCPGR